MKKLVFIDYASKGNSGLYSFNILKNISNENVDLYAHSQFSYTFSNNIKIIKLFSKFENLFKNSKFRSLYKFIDLYLCFLFLIVKLKKESIHNDLTVVVQFHQSFHAYLFLVKYLSKFSKVIITVHDAIELKHNYPNFIMSDRDEILSFADELIVHGEESVIVLKYLKKRIIILPFPLMCDKNIQYKESKNLSDKEIIFLFIGNVRIEKGIDTLIKAWGSLNSKINTTAKLIIAGSNTINYQFPKLKNLEVKDYYINDIEFFNILNSASYVVMPYSGGTNSGILSVSTCLYTPAITSNIPLFTDSNFVIDDLIFSEYYKLDDFLINIIDNHEKNYPIYINKLKIMINKSRKEFKEIIQEYYANY